VPFLRSFFKEKRNVLLNWEGKRAEEDKRREEVQRNKKRRWEAHKKKRAAKEVWSIY